MITSIWIEWMNSYTKATFKQLYWTVWISNTTFHFTLNLANPGLTIKFFLYHAYILFSYKKKKSFAIKESRTDNIMNICQIEIKQHAPPSQNMLFIHCSTLPPPTRTSNDARTTVPTDIRHSFKPTFFLHRMRFCSKLSFIFLFPILWHIFKWNC